MAANGFLTCHESSDGHTLYVKISNSFDFRLQAEFRQACHTRHYAHYVIDLENTSYIDSSALGILMLLYRHVGENRNAVRIIHCGGAVAEILRIAHFDQFFDIPDIAPLGSAAVAPKAGPNPSVV